MDNPLLAALFEEEERRPASVSELNSEIKAVLERSFATVWVEGEITNFHAAASGHWYFSLTDGDSLIKAACFKGQNFRIRFKPSDGLLVRIRGRLAVYEPRGELQIVVESLEPVGEGALAVAFEQIKMKLSREGLFDESLKRPLPPFPRKVGIVTSRTGAALHDILTVLKRRARSVNVVVVPTLVQGEFAAEQIAAGIATANEFNRSCEEGNRIDVLIVGRGGGSAEDLWAFNEEVVARAIRGSAIPVISAVGHEVDFTIADLAADLRAPTPSAAAEIVARAESEVIQVLDNSFGQLRRALGTALLTARADLQSLAMAPVFAEFPARIREHRYRADELLMQSEDVLSRMLRQRLDALRGVAGRLSPVALGAKLGENKRRLGLLEHRAATAAATTPLKGTQKLEKTMAQLDALSPLRVLHRGYSITERPDGHIIRDAAETQPGDSVRIRLEKGNLEATITAATE
ncbi:MAG: exodeoxyribonuclease VII large subunit [Acidobacteria bacterium]|nr:exodeoxyribonuclease VII large subunit [Acidobacteriota bacterium]